MTQEQIASVIQQIREALSDINDTLLDLNLQLRNNTINVQPEAKRHVRTGPKIPRLPRPTTVSHNKKGGSNVK